MNTIIEQLRRIVVNDLLQLNTIQKVWNIWQNHMNKMLGEDIDPEKILNLGDNLGEIFSTTRREGRAQGELSGGGAAWESLVCWYINLCTIGSRIVAVKKFSQVPLPLKDALTVNYGTFSCTTESDIVAIIFPRENELISSGIQLDNLEGNNNLKRKELFEIIDLLAANNFSLFGVGIIQCKTNWNDNAQIPMLWDMIYKANGFEQDNISIGRNGYSMRDLRRFSYSFVTVPTNSRDSYSPTSLSVKRVSSLSGGNYWGYPSINQVAKSIKEIFNNHNFQRGFSPNLRTVLEQNIQHIDTQFDYFQLR